MRNKMKFWEFWDLVGDHIEEKNIEGLEMKLFSEAARKRFHRLPEEWKCSLQA